MKQHEEDIEVLEQVMKQHGVDDNVSCADDKVS